MKHQRTKRLHGEYQLLTWDGDGSPSAHYVNGHVTPDEFRAELVRWFEHQKDAPMVPSDTAIQHVYVRSVRVEDDGYGNRQYEWRHTTEGRGFPMTYWEIDKNRNNP